MYFDAVHMDIAFRDCVTVGGYCYALILVNCATRYTIGPLALRLSLLLTLFRPFASSVPRLVVWPVPFTLTAISNY